MTQTLSFPGLGLELELNPILIRFTDTWAIHWYGVIIALAFLLGSLYVMKNAKRFGLDADRVFDVLIGSAIGGVVGARLYYVFFFYDIETILADPLRIIKIWQGGVAIYGGIIGGALAAILMCRWRKVPLIPLLDLMVGGLLIGQAVGRWGNFVNIEAFGSNTTVPWGMTSPKIVAYLQSQQAHLASIGVEVDPQMPVHPTFFYESMWCLVGFALLFWLSRHRRYDGQVTLCYFGWYGLGRFWIEELRTDSLLIGTVRVSQVVAMLCVVAAAACMFWVWLKIKQSGDPGYLRPWAETEAGRAMAAGVVIEEEPAAGPAPSPSFKAGAAGAGVPAPRRRTDDAASGLRGAKRMAAVRLGTGRMRAARKR